tara:strand:+ start:1445 stop:3142 length:1698 start_codon:yes stop_codon:yes gene_type:complete
MVNPTLLRAIASLLEAQSGKSISIPASGKQGTVISGEWRPQTHQVRQFERGKPVPVAAGDVVGRDAPHTPIKYKSGTGSKLVDVPEDRLVRDIEHIMPESGRGTVSPEQQVANLVRMLLIGSEGGRVPSSSPLLRELLEASDNIPVSQKDLFRQSITNPVHSDLEASKGLRASLMGTDVEFPRAYVERTRTGKEALPDEGGITATMERNIAEGTDPNRSSTIASSNMFEVILRRLTDEGVPPERARSIVHDVLPIGAEKTASRGQKAMEKATRSLRDKDFEYGGGSGLKTMQQTGRLQGAGSGLRGASEMVLLRAILGGIDDPKLRKGLAEATYLRGGKEASPLASAIEGGDVRALMNPSPRASRRAEKFQGTEDIDPPAQVPSRYGRDDIKGEAYADDPSVMPIDDVIAGQKIGRQGPDDRLRLAEIDYEGDVSKASIDDIAKQIEGVNDPSKIKAAAKPVADRERMFQMKSRIEQQLDELLESATYTKGASKRADVVEFKDTINKAKSALQNAWNEGDYDTIKKIGERLNKGDTKSIREATEAESLAKTKKLREQRLAKEHNL